MDENVPLALSFLVLTNLSNGQVGINDHIKNDFPLIYNIFDKQGSEKYPNNQAKQIIFVKEQCDACYDIIYPNESI